MAARYGQDRRRRLSREDTATLYQRANGRCQRCGAPLGVDWQQAHLVAYSNGGATSLAQMQAWCRDCNLHQGAQNAIDPSVPPLRAWQALAMDVVLERLWQRGTATVHAAPGAGKTMFAGRLFMRLKDAGLIERLVVVVPNRALLRQWTDALGAIGVHLDYQPRDGFFELPRTSGTVITYQGLSASAAGQIERMDESATLFVLDEVHHVGDQKAWGQAVQRIVGGDDQAGDFHPAGVLNMTGTLFRSSGANRIATVNYDTITDEQGVKKFQATADFSVPASDLIGIELRRPDLYAYDGTIELVDLRNETVISGGIADLDAGPQANTAIRDGFKRRVLVHEFAKAALGLLAQQLATIQDREPLKLLWVADDQQSARIAAEEIDKAAGRKFTELIISDEPKALESLRRASKSPTSCAIVAVRMVTEGFDCPQVSVIAYASATSAVLFLAQTMARAMRVTQTERHDQLMLPAQILIPNHPTLRQRFAEALIGHFHILEVPTEDGEQTQAGRDGCEGSLRMKRYELVDASTLDLHSATVLGEDDGLVLSEDLQHALDVCLELDIPGVYAPRVAVASRRMVSQSPLYTRRTAKPATGLQEAPAGPRDINNARRARVKKIVNWMTHHIDHDGMYSTVGVFQGKANDAAGIRAGGRDQASAEQLGIVEEWMLKAVRSHCQRTNCTVPEWAKEDT